MNGQGGGKMINTHLAGFLDLIFASIIGLIATTIAVLITKKPLSTITEKWTTVTGGCLVSFFSAGFCGLLGGGFIVMLLNLLFNIEFSEQTRWSIAGVIFILSYIWGVITLTKSIFED